MYYNVKLVVLTQNFTPLKNEFTFIKCFSLGSLIVQKGRLTNFRFTKNHRHLPTAGVKDPRNIQE